MTERVGPDQSAANEDLSPAERLTVMQTQHRTMLGLHHSQALRRREILVSR